jgi:hypothetical protein
MKINQPFEAQSWQALNGSGGGWPRSQNAELHIEIKSTRPPRQTGRVGLCLASTIRYKFSDAEAGMRTPVRPPSSPSDRDVGENSLDDVALARVMREVPKGAVAISGLAVGLLLIAWFLMYALVFLPRGMVG